MIISQRVLIYTITWLILCQQTNISSDMKNQSKRLVSLAKSLRDQHNDLNVDNTYNFLRASEILNSYLTNGFKKNGLNRTQVMILHFLLASGGSTTPTQMRNQIFRSMNAISKSMDSLDKMGLTKSKFDWWRIKNDGTNFAHQKRPFYSSDKLFNSRWCRGI